jgi:transcriptional regulator with XRE-family HTH domain
MMKKQDLHIGKKIKMLRALKGMTQEDLARKINKTRSMVSSIEQSGKVNHYTLLSVLKILNVSELDFEKFDGKYSLSGEPNIAYGNKSELELMKQKLDACEKENEMLKELIASQKKIIFMLEKKKKI